MLKYVVQVYAKYLTLINSTLYNVHKMFILTALCWNTSDYTFTSNRLMILWMIWTHNGSCILNSLSSLFQEGKIKINNKHFDWLIDWYTLKQLLNYRYCNLYLRISQLSSKMRGIGIRFEVKSMFLMKNCEFWELLLNMFAQTNLIILSKIFTRYRIFYFKNISVNKVWK